jgi:hypothetical protein
MISVEFNKNKTCATVTVALKAPKRDQKVPLAARRSVSKDQVIKEFKAQHPKYVIEEIAGPSSICNTRGPEAASGVWELTLSSRNSASQKKAARRKDESLASKPKASKNKTAKGA